MGAIYARVAPFYYLELGKERSEDRTTHIYIGFILIENISNKHIIENKENTKIYKHK